MIAGRLAISAAGILGLIVSVGILAGGASATSVGPSTTAGPTTPSCVAGSTLVLSSSIVPVGRPVHVSTVVPGLSNSPCVGSVVYLYAGLPAGCAPVPFAQFTCVPLGAGMYTITVTTHAMGASAVSHATLLVL